jgi:hypothetical protein
MAAFREVILDQVLRWGRISESAGFSSAAPILNTCLARACVNRRPSAMRPIIPSLRAIATTVNFDRFGNSRMIAILLKGRRTCAVG